MTVHYPTYGRNVADKTVALFRKIRIGSKQERSAFVESLKDFLIHLGAAVLALLAGYFHIKNLNQ